MTTLLNRILTSPELQDAREARDLDALVEGLNAQGLKEYQSRYVTGRTILAECPDGVNILTALEAASSASIAIKYAVAFLKQSSGLDVGYQATQRIITSLVPSVLSEAQAKQLKDMALCPVIVTRTDVEAALYNLDGTEKTE